MNNLVEVENSLDQQIALSWSQKELDDIRKSCAPKLNDTEFKLFVQIAKATSLNPFLREIWAVKYDKEANIFIGRDGYRKSAQRHPLYDYHIVDAVYSNDGFEVKNCEINHRYNLRDRGQLIGAYCIVKRRNSSIPISVFVELKEYTTGKSLWNNQFGKPATMIKKVAESQALRMAFQDLFSGTYSPEEFPESRTERKMDNYAAPNEISPSVIVDHEPTTGEIVCDTVNTDTLTVFIDLIKEKQISDEKVNSWLERANVSDISLMKQATVDAIINKLQEG